MENEENLISLDDAISHAATTGKPIKTFIGHNTGNTTFVINASLQEINELTQVANEQSKTANAIAQRKLDIPHASGMAKYILKGMLSALVSEKLKKGIVVSDFLSKVINEMGTQPYLAIPPMVASWRTVGPGGKGLKVFPLSTGDTGETVAFRFFLNQGDILWIVDGQHRRKAIEMVYDFIKYVLTYHKYPARGATLLYGNGGRELTDPEEIQIWIECQEMLKKCTVGIEIHLGLTIEQERQLFHDLNNLGKKVDKSLALQFDGSNPINTFIKECVIDGTFSDAGIPLISDRDKGEWESDGFSRQDLVSVNALLFLNKTNINGATPVVVDPKSHIAGKFWEAVVSIPNLSSPNAKQNTVAAQPVVLKALAKLAYDIFFGKNSIMTTEENKAIFWSIFEKFDFDHSNPVWNYYNLSEKERSDVFFSGLTDFLPLEEGGNRDIGKFDSVSNTFRFGAKHNDIYPIIGDMIRWESGLPSRKKQ